MPRLHPALAVAAFSCLAAAAVAAVAPRLRSAPRAAPPRAAHHAEVPTAGTASTEAIDVAPNAANPCRSALTRELVVDTATHRLTLCDRATIVDGFAVSLGAGGRGKQHEGDRKTPLGRYPLDPPRRSSSYGTFIAVGYPTPSQRRRGMSGSAVGVHGPPRASRWAGAAMTAVDWTDGCVALASDAEIERVSAWVRSADVHAIELR